MGNLAAYLTVAVIGLGTAVAQTPASPPDSGAPPVAGARRGRFQRPKGPPGPVPRLSDGHPDLTGIWNGFGGSGGVGPNILPWAQKVVDERKRKRARKIMKHAAFPADRPGPHLITQPSLPRQVWF